MIKNRHPRKTTTKSQPFNSLQLLRNIHVVKSASLDLLVKWYFSSDSEKPTEWRIVRTCSNQKGSRRDETLAHTINVQAVTDGKFCESKK